MNVSKILKQDFASTQTGTPYYASPEVWRDEDYNVKADIWSLGCVIFELCNLKQPFQASGLDRLYKKVQNKNIERFERGYSQELQHAVHECLTLDYRTRPCAKEMMKRKIFDEVKAEMLEISQRLSKLEREDLETAKTKGKCISRESENDAIIKMSKRFRRRWGKMVKEGDSESEQMQSIMETIPVDLDFKSLAQRLPKSRYSLSTDKIKTKETFEHKRSKSGMGRRVITRKDRDSHVPGPIQIKERMREIKRHRMKIVEQSRKKIQDKRRQMGSKAEYNQGKMRHQKRGSIASGISLRSGEGAGGNESRRRKRHLEMMKALGGGQGSEIGKSLMRERREQERILSKLEICHSQLVKRDSSRVKLNKQKNTSISHTGATQNRKNVGSHSEINNTSGQHSRSKMVNKIAANPSLQNHITPKHHRNISKTDPSAVKSVPKPSASNPLERVNNLSRLHVETKLKMMKEEVMTELSHKRKKQGNVIHKEGPTTKTRNGDSDQMVRDKECLVMVNHQRHKELVRKLFDNSISRDIEIEAINVPEPNGYLKMGRQGGETFQNKENVKIEKDDLISKPSPLLGRKDFNNRYNQVQINHQLIEYSSERESSKRLQSNLHLSTHIQEIQITANLQPTDNQDFENVKLPNPKRVSKDKSRDRRKRMMKIAGLKLELNNSYNLLRPVGNTARGRIQETIKGERSLMLEEDIFGYQIEDEFGNLYKEVDEIKRETPKEQNKDGIINLETGEKNSNQNAGKFYVDKISYTFSKKEKAEKRVREKMKVIKGEGRENVNLSNERKYNSYKDEKRAKTAVDEHYLSQNRQNSRNREKRLSIPEKPQNAIEQGNKAKSKITNTNKNNNNKIANNNYNIELSKTEPDSDPKPNQNNLTQNLSKDKIFTEMIDEYNFKGGLPKVRKDIKELPELTLERGNVVLKENSKRDNQMFINLMRSNKVNAQPSSNTGSTPKSNAFKKKRRVKQHEKHQNKSPKNSLPKDTQDKKQKSSCSGNENRRFNKRKNSRVEIRHHTDIARVDSKVPTDSQRRKSYNKASRKKQNSKPSKIDKRGERRRGDSRSGHLKSVSGNNSSKMSRGSKSTSIASVLQNQRRKNLRKHKMLLQRLNTTESCTTPAHVRKGRVSKPADHVKAGKSRTNKPRSKRAGSDRPSGHVGRGSKKTHTQTLSICDQIDTIIDSSTKELNPPTPKNQRKIAGNRHKNLSKKIGQTFKNINSRSGIHKNINSWQSKGNRLCLNLPSSNSRPNPPGPLSIYSRRDKNFIADRQSNMLRAHRRPYTSKHQADLRHYVPFKQFTIDKLSKIERLGKRGTSSRVEGKRSQGGKTSTRGNHPSKSKRIGERKKGKPKSLSQLGKAGTQRLKVTKNASNYQFPTSYTLQNLQNEFQISNLPSIPKNPGSYLSKLSAGLYQKPNPNPKRKKPYDSVRNVPTPKHQKVIQGPSTGAMESRVQRIITEKEAFPSQFLSGDLGGRSIDGPMGYFQKSSMINHNVGSLGVGKPSRTPKALGSKGTPKGGSFSTRHLLSLQSKYNSKFKSHVNISKRMKPVALFRNKDLSSAVHRKNARTSNLASQIEARTQFKSKNARSPRTGDFNRRGKGKSKKGKRGVLMGKSFMESMVHNGPSMNLSSKFLNSRQSNRIVSQILK